MKAVVLDGFFAARADVGWEPVERATGSLTVYEHTPQEEVAQRIGDAQAVFLTRIVLTRSLMEECRSLKFVCTLGTGYNTVDVEAARELGITVCNVPAYSTNAVAQTAVALLLEIAGSVSQFSSYVKAGGWVRPVDEALAAIPQMELYGKTMGIVGMGDIGYAVAKIAAAMGMNVLAYRRTPQPEMEAERIRFTDLDDLLARSDVVSLHCPLTAQTRGLINASRIALMKKGAILINTARGPIVDETAVIAALDSGRLFAYGADVLTREPAGEDNALALHPRSVVLPHVAWTPRETRERLVQIAANNLELFIKGTPQNVVN